MKCAWIHFGAAGEAVSGNLWQKAGEEAEEFLSDCFATVCKNLKEVRAYFKEEGADIAGMSSEELAEQAEVFALPDGRYLIVEA